MLKIGEMGTALKPFMIEIPENVLGLMGVLKEVSTAWDDLQVALAQHGVTAARDQFQEKVLRLSSLLHAEALQRPALLSAMTTETSTKGTSTKKPSPAPKKPATKKKSSGAKHHKREDQWSWADQHPRPDHLYAPSYLARITAKPTDPKPPAKLVALLGNRQQVRGKHVPEAVRKAVVVWATEEIKNGHGADAISRAVKVAPASIHHWIALEKRREKQQPEKKEPITPEPKGVRCSACQRDHFPRKLPDGHVHGVHAYNGGCRCHTCFTAKKAANDLAKTNRDKRAKGGQQEPAQASPQSKAAVLSQQPVLV